MPGMTTMGSGPTCGSAEQNRDSRSTECRVQTLRHDWFALAEKVRNPPFVTDAAQIKNAYYQLLAATRQYHSVRLGPVRYGPFVR